MSFITNPIAYGVRSAGDDLVGGPLINELMSGAGIDVTQVDVGGGNMRIRISATGASSSTYTAVTDPTVNNDGVDTAGIGRTFTVGDYWINITTATVFVILDNTTAAAVWAEVNTTNYIQVTLTDDDVTQISLGTTVAYEAFFLQYFAIAAIVNKTRAGILYIAHNDDGILDVRDEYVEIGGSMDMVPTITDVTTQIILNYTLASVGDDIKFRYIKTPINKVT